jgi:hypothetical protein
MTPQIFERIIYKGIEYNLANEPLDPILEEKNIKIKPSLIMSSCWRGYIGTWEIKQDKLYLISLKILGESDAQFAIIKIFPGQKEVFAEWFSGQLRIPLGDIIKAVYGGYDTIYERDIILTIDHGILIDSKEVENTIEGYE